MADRPFDDLVILDATQAEDLFLVSADRAVYSIRFGTLVDTILKSLGGPGFVIQPNDLALKLDADTNELYFTYKGERCEKGAILKPVTQEPPKGESEDGE